MAFILGQTKSVRRKVAFTQRGDDGKTALKADFIATFKLVDVDTLKERAEAQQASLVGMMETLSKVRQSKVAAEPDEETIEQADKIKPVELEEQYLREDLENIEGVRDEAGNDLAFSDDLISGLLNDVDARAALFRVHREVSSPIERKRGN